MTPRIKHRLLLCLADREWLEENSTDEDLLKFLRQRQEWIENPPPRRQILMLTSVASLLLIVVISGAYMMFVRH